MVEESMHLKTTFSFNLIVMFCVTAMFLGTAGFAQEETESNSTSTTVVSGGSSSTTATVAESDSAAITETGEASGRPQISVHTFENPPNYYNSTIGNGLTSIVITHLTKSGRFDVISRGDNLGLIIEEISLGEAGYIEGGEEIEKGHVLGVDYILSGRVTNFGYEESSAGGFLGAIGGFGGVDLSEEKAVVRVDFQLVDALTGLTVLAETAEGKESEHGIRISGADWGNWIGSVEFGSDEFMDSMIGQATLKAVENLMDQILPLFPVQGPILAVTPDFVIIELGANAGIEEGMILEVNRVELITNSSGEVVYEDEEFIGRVRVIDVDLTSCKAVIESGSGFLEGDICILPDEED